MHGTYKDFSGQDIDTDLDTMLPIAYGYSVQRRGWTGTLVLVPKNAVLVELRSSPEDFRGNSQDEAVQVTEEYAMSSYTLTAEDIAKFKSQPKKWVPRDLRSNAQQAAQAGRAVKPRAP